MSENQQSATFTESATAKWQGIYPPGPPLNLEEQLDVEAVVKARDAATEKALHWIYALKRPANFPLQFYELQMTDVAAGEPSVIVDSHTKQCMITVTAMVTVEANVTWNGIEKLRPVAHKSLHDLKSRAAA